MIHGRPSKRVSKRSGFRAVRSLPRLGPRAVWSHDWWDFTHSLLDLFTFVDLPEDHPARRYLGLSQNDGTVLGLEIGRDSIELTINHHDWQQLAAHVKGTHEDYRNAFPVILRFEQVSDLAILRAVEQGVYQKVRMSQATLGRMLQDIIRLECVYVGPPHERYVLAFNHSFGSDFRRDGKQIAHAYTDEIFLCIEAQSLTVEEHYREGWTKAFGDEYDDLAVAFEPVWPVPDWSGNDFDALIDSVGQRP